MRSARFKKCFLSTNTSVKLYDYEEQIQITSSRPEAVGFSSDHDEQSVHALARYAKKSKKACGLMKVANTARTQKVGADDGAAARRLPSNYRVLSCHHY